MEYILLYIYIYYKHVVTERSSRKQNIQCWSPVPMRPWSMNELQQQRLALTVAWLPRQTAVAQRAQAAQAPDHAIASSSTGVSGGLASSQPSRRAPGSLTPARAGRPHSPGQGAPARAACVDHALPRAPAPANGSAATRRAAFLSARHGAQHMPRMQQKTIIKRSRQ